MNLSLKNSNDNSFAFFQNPFHSFWMAGYECTDKLNAFGNRVDFLNVTGHLQMIDEDYKQLIPFGIKTVREGIRWSQIEKSPYEYDWSTVSKMIDHGTLNNIQQIWDICHFGFPDDLTPLHPLFAKRFAALCRAFVQFYRSKKPDGPLIVTPINEVSFLSWLGGDVRGTTPYCTKQGLEVKLGLMRAYIEGVSVMREMDASIRILTTEPLVNMVPPLNATSQQIAFAAHAHESQYESVDMLCGRICPELGGLPEYLDILGFNYYYNNQWITENQGFLSWTNIPFDLRWKPLRALLLEAYHRYEHAIAVTETSHPGIDRPDWIRFVGEECAALLYQGIPLWGVCLYPIIDRPDWDRLTPWHRSGLWDAELQSSGPPKRILYQPYADALKEVQAKLASAKHEPIPVA
jgi:beta-glucosidase/6-phospho-beta-glucosidase/beta-galactosidase